MYNRYIPQPDGSYRRKPTDEPVRNPQPGRPKPPPKVPDTCQSPPCPEQPPKPCPKQDAPIGSFLKNLLPKGLDTGDLMVILLLLLIAGDCEEDRNNALLTLAIYLFM